MPYFCTSDGCRLYYEEEGSGKAVVFIHGWSCNRLHFRKQLPAFIQRYKVLSYDLRGHGDSEITEKGFTLERYARDLQELIEDRGLKDFTLIGWSMGVHVIWEYIKQFGCQDISKCVYIDMTPKLVTDEQWDMGLHGRYSFEDAVRFSVNIARDWDRVWPAFLPLLFASSGLKNRASELEWAGEQARKNSAYAMMSMWLSMTLKDYREILPWITVPTLITYGTESALYEEKNSIYQQKMIKDAALLAFPGCGHSLHIEDPEGFNSKVMQFIG